MKHEGNFHGAPVNAGVEVIKTSSGEVYYVRKAQPTPSDVHVNTPLTMISVAMMQDSKNFIASKVFPNIPVAKQSDRYWTYDRGFFNRSEMKERAPSTETPGIGYAVNADSTYYCPVYGIHKDIDDQTRANEDAAINSDRDATILLTHQALLKKELLWAASYFKAGVWTFNKTGVASGPSTDEFLQWNDHASTPIEDVQAYRRSMMESTGFEPNTLVLGRAVYDALIVHPDIQSRIKGGATTDRPSLANINLLSQILEVERILVANAIQNTAAEGQTNAHSFIMGKGALLCYAAPTPGLMVPSAGYSFSWTGYLGASTEGMRIMRFRIDPKKSDRVEMELSQTMKLIAVDLGCYMATAVS
jgi:hypothetical protein